VDEMSARLGGKVAIITGGGSGMGRAACVLFARAGARVVAADLNEAGVRETVASIKHEGGESLAVGCDVSRAADVRGLVQATLEAYGRLDILFNNAGRHLPKDAEATSEEEWDSLLATNLRSMFLTVKYAAAELKRTRGVIINMASMVALLGQANSAAYKETNVTSRSAASRARASRTGVGLTSSSAARASMLSRLPGTSRWSMIRSLSASQTGSARTVRRGPNPWSRAAPCTAGLSQTADCGERGRRLPH
jgi:NAD(P)-dependent dehydrogenase (short-subunit alcohol dehydrogenase family)